LLLADRRSDSLTINCPTRPLSTVRQSDCQPSDCPTVRLSTVRLSDCPTCQLSDSPTVDHETVGESDRLCPDLTVGSDSPQLTMRVDSCTVECRHWHTIKRRPTWSCVVRHGRASSAMVARHPSWSCVVHHPPSFVAGRLLTIGTICTRPLTVRQSAAD